MNKCFQWKIHQTRYNHQKKLIREICINQRFVDDYGLKVEAASSVKIKQILYESNNPARKHKRGLAFTTDSGMVDLHPTEGTH